MHQHGVGINAHHSMAAEYFQQAADKSDGNALVSIWTMSLDNSSKHLETASSKGSLRAKVYLGRMALSAGANGSASAHEFLFVANNGES